MADLSITPANVKKISLASLTTEIQFGETVVQGKLLYHKLTSGQYHLADCETSIATAAVAGIALTPGAVDEYGSILTDGPINIGATLVQGESYFLSTSGLIMPESDIATADYIAFLGIASTTAILDVSIKNFGWQKT